MPLLIPDVLEVIDPVGEPAPLVLDSPHSGNVYPDDFGAVMPLAELRKAEDAFVDELFGAAPGHGATLLRALFPRSYVDPNRADDDIDESLLDGPWPGSARPGPKVELGIGLVARRYAGGAVYARRLGVAEVQSRIERCYRPYHRALAKSLDDAHGRFGAVWHVDCHSMPALSSEISPEGPGVDRPDFCIGDRDGSTCEPAFTALVAGTLREMGYRVTVNDPYKGVELVRRHSDPGRGRHSLQIEVNRALYMDEERIERAPGFTRLAADLETVIGAVADHARRRA